MSMTNDPAPAGMQPLTVHLVGNLLTFRARSGDTDNGFSLIDVLTAPGQGSPPHRQEDSESFFILDGEYDITLDGETRRCRTGDFLHVRPGQAHVFRNPGDRPARMLIINTPAGLHEGFFEAAGDVVPFGTTEFPPVGEIDVARLVDAAGRFGIELLPAA
jgi:quercetin dioxygenase-like cupin family protein